MKVSKNFYRGFNKLFRCSEDRLSYDELNKNLVLKSYNGIKSDWEAVLSNTRNSWKPYDKEEENLNKDW